MNKFVGKPSPGELRYTTSPYFSLLSVPIDTGKEGNMSAVLRELTQVILTGSVRLATWGFASGTESMATSPERVRFSIFGSNTHSDVHRRLACSPFARIYSIHITHIKFSGKFHLS